MYDFSVLCIVVVDMGAGVLLLEQAWRFSWNLSSVWLGPWPGGRFGVLVAFFVARLACLGAPAASGGSAAFPAPLLRFANCWSAVGALI